MAKRIIKPDSGNTLVLQEDNGSIDALTVETNGNVTLGGNLVIPDSGTIGSASTTGAMTIDSGGKVGIGTTPSEILDVQTSGGRFKCKALGASSVELESDNAFKLKASLNDLILDGANNVKFTISDTERMRIDSSGHVIAPYGVTLGTAAGTYNAANTLDDYEEGTFELTIDGGYTGTGISDNSCTYIKIGNVVHCHISITLNGSGSATSSDVVFGGLPFNTLSQSAGLRNNNFISAFSAYSTGTGLGDNAFFYCTTKYSSDQLTVSHFSGTTIDGLIGTELGTSAIVRTDITYFVSDFT